jgi:hypothetical protein
MTMRSISNLPPIARTPIRKFDIRAHSERHWYSIFNQTGATLSATLSAERIKMTLIGELTMDRMENYQNTHCTLGTGPYVTPLDTADQMDPHGTFASGLCLHDAIGVEIDQNEVQKYPELTADKTRSEISTGAIRFCSAATRPELHPLGARRMVI